MAEVVLADVKKSAWGNVIWKTRVFAYSPDVRGFIDEKIAYKLKFV